jgi:hypothetical protein
VLAASDEEIDEIRAYMASQAPDLAVEFLQKVYVENIAGHLHAVWDFHTNKDRWWVITNPTNLYSQEQFPNVDYALTFHVGLCIRIPRMEKQKISDLPIEPFAACYRQLSSVQDALAQASSIADYQGIGVRCRETLLSFVDVAQTVVPWTSVDERPQRANFKRWVDHVCAVTLAGQTHENRRHLLKTLLEEAWKFVNWLTHAQKAYTRDAEAGVTLTENAVTLGVSTLIQHLRGVPDECPVCGSHQLSPERGYNDEVPEITWERPVCNECGWAGEPEMIQGVPATPAAQDGGKADRSKCIVDQPPLRHLKKPAQH